MSQTVAEVVVRLKDDVSKTATKAASAMDDLAAAERDAAKAADSLDASTAKLEHFGQKAGDVGASSKKLAGALDMIVPGAGNLARAVDDVGDVMEVSSLTFERFGLSVGGLGAILATAAAALLAYKAVMFQVEAAADRLHRAQVRMTGSAGAFSDLVQGAIDAERGADLAAMTDEERTRVEIKEKWAIALKQSTNALLEEKAAIEANRAAAGAMTPSAGELAMGPLGMGAFGFRAASGALTSAAIDDDARLDEIAAAMTAAAEAAAVGEAADLRAAKAKSTKAAATREATAAVQEESYWTKIEAAEQKRVNAEIAARDKAIVDATSALADIRRDATLAILDPADRIIAQYDAEIARVRELAGLTGEQAAETEALVGALETAEARDLGALLSAGASSGGTPAFGAQTLAEMLGTFGSGPAGILGAAAQGVSSLAGIGAAAGPIGAAVAAAVSLVMQEGAIQQLADGFTKLGQRMTQIGPELAKGLDTFASEGFPAILGGIVQLFADVFLKVIPKFFAVLYDPKTWTAAAEAIVVAVAGVLGDVFRAFEGLFRVDTWRQVGKWIVEGLLGIDGESEKGTGPFNLFGSEGGFADFGRNVGNAFSGGQDSNRSRTAGASRSRSGGDVHVHVQGVALGTAQDFARELGRHLGTASRRITIPAGSVAGG